MFHVDTSDLLLATTEVGKSYSKKYQKKNESNHLYIEKPQLDVDKLKVDTYR